MFTNVFDSLMFCVCTEQYCMFVYDALHF